MNIKNHFNGMATTFNPRKGGGWVEALFGVMLLLLVILTLLYEVQEVPRWLAGLLGTVFGYYFGAKAVQHGSK